jgi:hypothetical protein
VSARRTAPCSPPASRSGAADRLARCPDRLPVTAALLLVEGWALRSAPSPWSAPGPSNGPVGLRRPVAGGSVPYADAALDGVDPTSPYRIVRSVCCSRCRTTTASGAYRASARLTASRCASAGDLRGGIEALVEVPGAGRPVRPGSRRQPPPRLRNIRYTSVAEEALGGLRTRTEPAVPTPGRPGRRQQPVQDLRLPQVGPRPSAGLPPAGAGNIGGSTASDDGRASAGSSPHSFAGARSYQSEVKRAARSESTVAGCGAKGRPRCTITEPPWYATMPSRCRWLRRLVLSE